MTVICLDMAGTTVRDDGAVLAAFDSALSSLGLGPGEPGHQQARDHALATMGQSKIEVFTTICDGDRDRAAAANASFEHHYQERIAAGEVAALPGVAEAITSLRAAGHRVALTTGFAPITRDAIIAALGWTDLVDLALSPVDAGRGRPWPDMVLTAAVRLAVTDVRDLVVAGDTVSDLLAGHRAGAGIVAGVLTGTHGRADFATVPHTHVLDSVTDLVDLLADR